MRICRILRRESPSSQLMRTLTPTLFQVLCFGHPMAEEASKPVRNQPMILVRGPKAHMILRI